MNNLKYYMKSPEMRLTWLLLFLTFTGIVMFAYFLSGVWMFTGIGLLVVIGTLVFFINLRSAQTNVALRVEKGRAENIIASIGDGIVIYDTEFRIVVFNSIAEQILNVPAGSAIGQSFSLESIKKPEFQLVTQVIFPSLAPNVIHRSDQNIFPNTMDLSFDDPRLELRVITNQLQDENGRTIGFIKIIRDRTREIELLKSKSDFITVAAHQLRTPLSAISWTFESLKHEQLGPSQQDLVNIGASASSNLSKTVESLLSVSKIEEGRFGYSFKTLDLVAFLGEILSQAEPIAREYKVDVYFEGPPSGSLMIPADSDKLSLVFSNLLDNAIKYNVPNGQVVVRAEKMADKPYVQISVKDTGMGIPQEDLGKLFTKFFRGGNVMKKETSGSGLGLYIVKNIIRRHGGEIRVESELNRGTTFYFTLPIDPSLIPPKELVYDEE